MGFLHKERKEMERRDDGGVGREGMGGRGGWVVGWRQTVSQTQGEEE